MPFVSPRRSSFQLGGGDFRSQSSVAALLSEFYGTHVTFTPKPQQGDALIGT